MKRPETNLDYYGFSLLASVQREFNSKFKNAGDFFEQDSNKVVDFFNLNCRARARELDLPTCLFGGALTREGVAALGDAALACGPGMVSTLWSVSQWTPDRKRSALVMVNWRKRTEWMATSISPCLRDSDAESYLITVDNKDCEELCLKFMELVRERKLLE